MNAVVGLGWPSPPPGRAARKPVGLVNGEKTVSYKALTLAWLCAGAAALSPAVSQAAPPTASQIETAIKGVLTDQTVAAPTAPKVSEANGACNSKLIQFVDTPLAVHYNQYGQFRATLNGGDGILAVGNCRHLYFELGSSKATGYTLYMGKISGSTLSQGFPGSQTGKIQSTEIMGPEIVLGLQGPANTSDSVQLWVYLTD